MDDRRRKSGSGTPEDTIPTYPMPADKTGHGRPPKKELSEAEIKSRRDEAEKAEPKIKHSGFAHDHGAEQDPRPNPSERLERAVEDVERAAKEMSPPHVSEDKGNQASGTLDAEGEGDRGEHRSGNRR